MARVRLFVEADLAAGAAVELATAQAHYLRTVMRHEPGDEIALFNGRDGEWAAHLATLERGRASAVADQALRPQADGPDVRLLFAPVKRGPLDLIVQKATELGVAALWPVETRRTIVERVNLDRLRAIAVEAAEQCGRLTIPDIRAPQALDEALAGWPGERPLLLCDETGAAPPIARALGGLGRGPAAFVIGPEGGFSETELDRLRGLPFVTPVALGPRILRAETAALAALACWQALCGDWR